MLGLDGPQLADQGVELGVGDLGVVEPVVAVVVVGDEAAQLLGAGRRIRPAGPVAGRVPGSSPAIPEPMTTSGSAGS